jgi:hypothetical protein
MLRWCAVLLLPALLAFAGEREGVVRDTTIRGDRLDADLYGNFYVLDRGTSLLRQYGPDRKLLHEVGGQGWEGERFDRPAGLWARNGIDVYVADYGNHRVVRLDRALAFVSSLSTRDSDNPEERFGYPTDVALSRLGELYICDSENSRVLRVSRQNTVTGTFGDFGGGLGRLTQPREIEVSPADVVYVLDNKRVVMYDVFGNFTGVLADGLLNEPRALWSDQQGIMVVDGEMLYCFDGHGRPLCSVMLTSAVGDHTSPVRSIAASRGTVYLLTDEGLVMLPDPRAGGLDK